MMKWRNITDKAYIVLLLCLLLIGATELRAQGVGTWTPYLSYYNTTLVDESDNYVFAVANGSLYRYGKDDNSLKFFSRDDGLNDNSISNIGYNQDVDALLIVYSDGNIDLMTEDGGSIYNLPYLKSASTVQDKTVNSIYFYDEYAYLCLNACIVVVNMSKQEIAETYRLSKAVKSVVIHGSNIYAATDEGLLSANRTDNLLDPSVWETYALNTTKFTASKVAGITVFDGRLCFYVSSKGVYYEDENGAIQNLCVDSSLSGMRLCRSTLLAYTSSGCHIISSLTDQVSVATGTTKDICCQNTAGNYWVAAGSDGLVGMKLSGEEMTVTVYDLIPLSDSPKRNYCDFMTFQQGKLLVAGGGRWTNRYNRTGTLMIYEDGEWTNIDESVVASESGTYFRDVTSVAVDPADPTHYFASTWGEGVFEFKDDAFVANYGRSNSSLVSATTSNPDHYVRVEGLTYDADGNLWMTNTAASQCINVLKADGSWTAITSSDYNVLYDQALVDKILITSWGDKWVNIPRVDVSIVVFNENGTIDDASDDTVNKFSTFNLNSASGESISVSGYFCMAEDQDGDIWIGTNRGPIICPVPKRATTDPSNIYCTRIVRTSDDDVASYFLDNTTVNAIAVDGGNRKWLATEGYGVFLVSADGSETIEHFTTENSPLLSDVVNAIAINPETGEVFFGTENGIISYMSDATEPQDDFSSVYAYPNPVRPTNADKVTITGLMADSNVKITDLSGHIIYQGKSNGGTLTWNCRNRTGARVATGIYLVLATDGNGRESLATKIMVIK